MGKWALINTRFDVCILIAAQRSPLSQQDTFLTNSILHNDGRTSPTSVGSSKNISWCKNLATFRLKPFELTKGFLQQQCIPPHRQTRANQEHCSHTKQGGKTFYFCMHSFFSIRQSPGLPLRLLTLGNNHIDFSFVFPRQHLLIFSHGIWIEHLVE